MEASFLRWEQFDDVSFPISWVLLLKQNNHKTHNFLSFPRVTVSFWHPTDLLMSSKIQVALKDTVLSVPHTTCTVHNRIYTAASHVQEDDNF